MDRDGGTVDVQVNDAVLFSRVQRNIGHNFIAACIMCTCGLQLIRKEACTMTTFSLQLISKEVCTIP